MSRPPIALPAALAAGPFTVARARELGVGTGRLRHTSLVVPTRGVRASAQPRSISDAAHATAIALESPFAFSHLTAGHLLGMPLPRPPTADDALHVMRPSGLARPVRPGVVAHRGLERRGLVRVGGLPVVGPLDTWRDLSRCLPPDELVVLGDWLLGRGVTLEDLAATVRGHHGERGTRAARAALPLVRPGSESRMETLARLVICAAGLPEPELNADVLDDDGRWILRADFLWRAQRVIGEYQGDIHRTDRRRWQADIVRRRQAEDSRWTVVDMSAPDVFQPYQRGLLLARLAQLLG